jgi:hypothetical protein
VSKGGGSKRKKDGSKIAKTTLNKGLGYLPLNYPVIVHLISEFITIRNTRLSDRTLSKKTNPDPGSYNALTARLTMGCCINKAF